MRKIMQVVLRAWVLPRWCGFGLIALVVLLALGAYGGFVVVGLIWLALGYALWSGKRGDR